jgi:hypothetical protein
MLQQKPRLPASWEALGGSLPSFLPATLGDPCWRLSTSLLLMHHAYVRSMHHAQTPALL